MNKCFRLVLMILLCGLSSLVMAEMPFYKLSWHYDQSGINLHTAAQLPFKPLKQTHDLPAMANKGTYLFKIDFGKPIMLGGLILFIENEHLDTVSLYKRVGSSLTLVERKGNSFPQVRNRFGSPDFTLPAGETEYYLLISFKKDVSFPISIKTPDDMNRWSTSTFFLLGLYYGVCLMFLMLNLFLFFYLKDRLFLYYGIFLIFIAFSIAYADGLFTFLTNNSWLLNNVDVLLHFGMAVACTLFARRFLGLNGRNATYMSLALLGTALLTYLLSLVCKSYCWFLAGETTVIALLCFFWLLALRQIKGQLHSQFFVLGYGVFLFCAIDYFLLRKFGIFVFDMYPGQLKTGSAIELVVIMAAIMYRIRALDQQNQYYRKEIEQHIQRIMESQTQALRQDNEFFANVQHRYALSDRELEVLRGISEGLTNTQIAERIFLSVSTVKFHTRNIFDKLEITNRTQALGKLYGERYS